MFLLLKIAGMENKKLFKDEIEYSSAKQSNIHEELIFFFFHFWERIIASSVNSMFSGKNIKFLRVPAKKIIFLSPYLQKKINLVSRLISIYFFQF